MMLKNIKLENIIKEEVPEELRKLLELKLRSLILRKKAWQLRGEISRESKHIGIAEIRMIENIMRMYRYLSIHGKTIVQNKIQLLNVEEKEAKITGKLYDKLDILRNTELYEKWIKYREMLEKTLKLG